jgi:hypothetical protein
MRSYFIFDIKQIDFAGFVCCFFNFSVVSSTALWEVWCSSFFAKGIKGVSDRHHQHQELPDRMFQKVNSHGVWRPLDCRA